MKSPGMRRATGGSRTTKRGGKRLDIKAGRAVVVADAGVRMAPERGGAFEGEERKPLRMDTTSAWGTGTPPPVAAAAAGGITHLVLGDGLDEECAGRAAVAGAVIEEEVEAEVVGANLRNFANPRHLVRAQPRLQRACGGVLQAPAGPWRRVVHGIEVPGGGVGARVASGIHRATTFAFRSVAETGRLKHLLRVLERILQVLHFVGTCLVSLSWWVALLPYVRRP